MRSAEAKTAWRRAAEKDRGFRIKRIESAGKPPLKDFGACLPNGLTIICGLNGVGKTTLLQLLKRAIGDDASTDLRGDLVDNGTFSVSILDGADEVRLELDQDSGRSVTMLDAFRQCMHVLEVARQPNFKDLAEGVEPYEFDAKELRTAEYVIGKSYSAIRVHEIEDPEIEDGILPLFEVESEGITYGFDAMGLGELAALMSLWHLQGVEAGTVLLIEEPETFLSSRATVALLDVLAEAVHSRRLYAVVTSHSPSVAASVPLDLIRVLGASGSSLGLRQPASRAELELLLGSHAGLARAALVEDRTAALVTSELISRFEGVWGRSVEVLETGGVDVLVRICETFPRSERIRLVGVVDGDQPAPSDTQWPIVALPGPDNPDRMLRDAALGALQRFADLLARDLDTVRAGTETLVGADEHDWFPDLAQTLGLDAAALLRAALTCWLDDVAHQEVAAEILAGITDALSK